MKISTKGRYGLRLLVELARRRGQGPVMVEALARSQDIPSAYIHQILLALKNKNLVRTVRGPRGGYELVPHPSTVSAWDVVCALEGDMEPVPCVLRAGTCERDCTCPTREVWVALGNATREVLQSFTLEQLANKSEALQCGSVEYFI